MGFVEIRVYYDEGLEFRICPAVLRVLLQVFGVFECFSALFAMKSAENTHQPNRKLQNGAKFRLGRKYNTAEGF